MALYVTRPRRDEERIGRGLPSAVTTCVYDSGLSRPGIEPRSAACEANALPLRHRGGFNKELSYIVMLQISYPRNYVPWTIKSLKIQEYS